MEGDLLHLPFGNNHEGIRVRVRVRVRLGLQRGVVSEKLTNVISQMSHPAKKHFKLDCLRESLRFPFRFPNKGPSSKLPFVHGFQWRHHGCSVFKREPHHHRGRGRDVRLYRAPIVHGT